LALARIKVESLWRPTPEPKEQNTWLVARVCSEYVEHCRVGVSNGSLGLEYYKGVARYLNDLCSYCGALPVDQLKKGHVLHWVETHDTWRSPVSQRDALIIVQAAFNRAERMHNVQNPLIGLKKPSSRPRLHSFTPEDETAIYETTDQAYGDFLFAAIHTGLRPFCELARLTAKDVIVAERGMMWRVYSSKTRKTRVIPIRPEVADLTRQLMSDRCKSGSVLFQNPQGNPWKKVTGVARFRAIKSALNWNQNSVKNQYSNYTARHTFAHRMLAGYWNNGAGCSIETLAELMGNSPAVAFAHYGREWAMTYQDPLWAAIESG